jgi:GT2 family glycosyltransferase
MTAPDSAGGAPDSAGAEADRPSGAPDRARARQTEAGTGFSAVVVIHDSEAELAELLESIRRHLPRPPQLVAVDNASSDAGATLARDAGAEVIGLERNVGFGAASNAGLERAREDVTVLLNPDVVLLDDGLARLAAAARRTPALLAPRLLRPDGGVQDSAHPIPGGVDALLPALAPTPLLPRALREHADPWRSRRPRAVGWALAACLAARTDLLRDLGPFCAEDFLFYEDMDLCLRAAARGIATRFEPSVTVRHGGAHATGRRYGGEPYELLACRRREVVRRTLGARALALDDVAQALTFVSRAGIRMALGRDASVQRSRLRALRGARRAGAQNSPS